MTSFDAQNVDARVFVFREGLLTSFGHDVTLRVTSLSFEVGDGDAITAEFDLTSLKVEGDVKDSDRDDIEGNAQKALDTTKHPTVTFTSTSVSRDGASAQVDGELTLHGTTKPISVQATDDGRTWTAEITLDQRDYGIKPFSAMLGALKVKPEVTVSIAVPHVG